MVDHVHMLISIPPKYAVSNVVGYIKEKSAIHLARVYAERKRNFAGQSFWARGYFVSTVGRDEALIRNYIRHQEKEDERLEQLGLWRWAATVSVAPRVGAALATPFSRFERLTVSKTPGFAGGWLLNRCFPAREIIFTCNGFINRNKAPR